MSKHELFDPDFGLIRLQSNHPTVSCQMELPEVFNADLNETERILLGQLIKFTGLLYCEMGDGKIGEAQTEENTKALVDWFLFVCKLLTVEIPKNRIVGSLDLFSKILFTGDRNEADRPIEVNYEAGV